MLRIPVLIYATGTSLSELRFNGYTSSVPHDLYDLREAVARNPSLIGLDAKNKRNDNSIAFSGYIGYQLDLCKTYTLGVELGYKYMGKIKRKTTNFLVDETPTRELNTQGIDLLFMGKYMHCSGVNFFGKAGVIALRTKLDDRNFISVSNPQIDSVDYFVHKSETYYDLAPEYVLGMGYQFNRCMNLTLSYTHIYTRFAGKGNNAGRDSYDGDPGGSPSFSMLGIGIERLF